MDWIRNIRVSFVDLSCVLASIYHIRTSQIACMSDADVQTAKEEMEITIVNNYAAKELENVPAPIEELGQASCGWWCSLHLFIDLAMI